MDVITFIKNNWNLVIIGILIGCLIVIGSNLIGHNTTQSTEAGYSSAYTSTTYTEKFTSVTDSTKQEIRSTGELSGTERAIKYVNILSQVHSTKTPADYENTSCCVYWDTTVIGCVSQYLGGSATFEADKRSTGTNVTFDCVNLGNSGSDTVIVEIGYVYR